MTDDQETTAPAADFELDETLRMKQISDQLRREDLKVDDILAHDREARISHLQTIYQGRGVEVDRATLEEAVDRHLNERLRFEPPPGGFGNFLATCWVDRITVIRWVVVPVILLGLFGGLAYGAWQSVKYAAVRAQEVLLEGRVEDQAETLASYQSRLKTFASHTALDEMPENETRTIRNHLDEIRQALEGLTTFVEAYAPAGDAGEAVTVDNLDEVKKHLNEATADVRQVPALFDTVESLFERHATLKRLATELEATRARIRNQEAPDALRNRAETMYQEGLVAIRNRNPGRARSRLSDLKEVIAQATALRELGPKADRLLKAIRTVAEEQAAVSRAETLHRQARTALETTDLKEAQQAVAQLEKLKTRLNRAYEIVITGGKWRHPKGDRSRRNYYLIVEARGPNGERIPLDIENEEEGGRLYRGVTQWGERVPEAVYNRVGADKKDDGIIQNNKAGRKKRGHLEPTWSIERLGGRITHW